jgi:hypothetical protein
MTITTEVDQVKDALRPHVFDGMDADMTEAWLDDLARAAIAAMPQSLRVEELETALLACGSALDDWIKIVGGKHREPEWLRAPTFDECQAAMEANNRAAKALSQSKEAQDG